MPTPSTDRPFFDRVESLRGLGALIVAGYHFTGCVVHGTTLLPPGRASLFLLPGPSAVMVFFVLSGFVLRLSLQHGPQRARSAVGKFLVARVFRLYPIVVVGTMLAASGISAGRFVANLLLIDVSLNPHLWALQVEQAMVPVILALYFLERRFGRYSVAGVAALTTALAFLPHWAGWPPLSKNLFAFALGMTIPTFGRGFAAGLSRSAATRWVAASVLVTMAAGPCFGSYSRVTAIAVSYAAAGMIALAAYRPDVPILKSLDSRWLRRIGSASCSFYVLHMATAPLLIAVATAVLPVEWSAAAPVAVGIVAIAVWLAVLAPIMVVASRLIEAPGIALGRRVVRSLRLDAKPVAAIPAKRAA